MTGTWSGTSPQCFKSETEASFTRISWLFRRQSLNMTSPLENVAGHAGMLARSIRKQNEMFFSCCCAAANPDAQHLLLLVADGQLQVVWSFNVRKDCLSKVEECWAIPPVSWDFPEEFPEKFRKDPGNALRAFPEIRLKSTGGIPQAL